MTDFIIRPVRLSHLYPVRKTFIVFIDNKKKERWKSGRFPLSFLLEDSFGRLFWKTLSEDSPEDSPDIILGLLLTCLSLIIHASSAKKCFLLRWLLLSNLAYSSRNGEPGNHKAVITRIRRYKHKPPSHKSA